jgi:uracil-DNA glycosylase family 4
MAAKIPITPEAPHDCPLCPRLVDYRQENAAKNPEWFNGAVPSFGDPKARLVIIGLAPGRQGANRTGRPFTGDFAGELLYGTLIKFGFAKGKFLADPNDGLTLHDAMITNAVRCAPPGNKPTGEEETTCRPFLQARLAALPRVKVLITLGDVSRRNVLRALGAKQTDMAPGHGAEAKVGKYTLINSYHCSRLNTNTGRLTAEMFEAIFARAKKALDA